MSLTTTVTTANMKRLPPEILFLRQTCNKTGTWPMYEGWNFNSGNYLFTTDTKEIHVSKFYCPSLCTLCTTRCQRCGSRRIPLAAPVVLTVRMERSTA